MSSQATADPDAERRVWLGVLARSPVEALGQHWEALPRQPAFVWLRQPEIAAVMVRARAGGTGRRFNLGEMTVTRCAVRLEDGEVGLGYVAGRDKRHAALVAVFDAILQAPPGHVREAAARAVEDLADLLDRRSRERAARVATSRVDFIMSVAGNEALCP